MRAHQSITGHVINNPAYTNKFQLKITMSMSAIISIFNIAFWGYWFFDYNSWITAFFIVISTYCIFSFVKILKFNFSTWCQQGFFALTICHTTIKEKSNNFSWECCLKQFKIYYSSYFLRVWHSWKSFLIWNHYNSIWDYGNKEIKAYKIHKLKYLRSTELKLNIIWNLVIYILEHFLLLY